MTDTPTPRMTVEQLIYNLPIIHQFGCMALEREDGGLLDYNCSCGNERKAIAAIEQHIKVTVREQLRLCLNAAQISELNMVRDMDLPVSTHNKIIDRIGELTRSASADVTTN